MRTSAGRALQTLLREKETDSRQRQIGTDTYRARKERMEEGWKGEKKGERGTGRYIQI